MKNMVKFLKIVCFCCVVVCFVCNKADAKTYYTFNDHHLTGYGVGAGGKHTQKYFVVDNVYPNAIGDAMDGWIYTTKRLNYSTPISFKKTTKRSESVIDISKVTSLNGKPASALAWTEFYKTGGGDVDPYKSNWKFCYVKLYKKALDERTIAKRTAVVSHEVGHCFGLAHNNGNTKSIMCQEGSGRSVKLAQICDLKGINHLY